MILRDALRKGWALCPPLVAAALAACQGNTTPAVTGGTDAQARTDAMPSHADAQAPHADAQAPLTAFGQRCVALGMTRAQCDNWSHAVLPESLPPSKGNNYADDERAAQLGFELFFDLNVIGTKDKPVRCAGCHTPEHMFANNVPLAIGASRSLRNALPLTDAARSYPHFWDGRADSLWSQPLITIENVDEVNGTRLGVAHVIADRYRAEYEAIFGPMPPLSDTKRFPASGKPGVPEWDAMATADQVLVNRVFSNIGKAFEAYDRKIASGRSAFDRFVLGDMTAMSDAAQAGMATFTKFGCRTCHSGSTFSDGDYHDLDLPLPTFAPIRDKVQGDRGRGSGREFVMKSEWNSLGQYYDRQPGEQPKEEEDLSPRADGTFLTPSLRNVGDTAPYTHTGVFTTLEDTVRFIASGGGPACVDLAKNDVSDADVANLVEFLNTLHGDTAPLPWSFWPPISGKPAADGGTTYDAGKQP